MHLKAPLKWLCLLLAVNTVNFFDRQVLPAVAEPLRHEWDLSDFQLGALATAFTLFYAFAGIPLGRLAEPSEVVAMVKLLCSANGRYITGQTIHVNGGLYMNS